jgi:2-phosphosulfolactate phosphatase
VTCSVIRVDQPAIDLVPLTDAGSVSGLAVVIDVLRAFTTAAVALDRGAEAIVLTGSVEDALAQRERLGDGALAMGEVDGARPAGFDLSNSPAELSSADVAGRVLVHRTTAGTSGAVACRAADAIVAASFVCAEATVRWLRARGPASVTFVVTGEHDSLDGDEDRACAEYLAARLLGDTPDPGPYLERVARSDAGARFGQDGPPQYRPEDLRIASQLDSYDLAMPVARSGGALVLRGERR